MDLLFSNSILSSIRVLVPTGGRLFFPNDLINYFHHYTALLANGVCGGDGGGMEAEMTLATPPPTLPHLNVTPD